MLQRTTTTRASLPQSTTPPWALYSWPPVFWQANTRKRPRFVHLATKVTNPRGRSTPCCGNTVWGGFSDKGDAGIAWDWIEIGDGIIAMVDPMSITSNLQLVGSDGDLLSATASALQLNQIVHRLSWQEEVRRLLRAAAS